MQPSPYDVTLTKTAAHYFRHKGIKVQYSDIENAIDACPFVKKSAVRCREDLEGNRQLVAYILPAGTFSQSSITSFLEGKLQPFMMPAVWACISELPYTASGSMDREALQEVQLPEVAERELTLPGNQTETALVVIIKEVLRLQTISINDNFFRLGGTSLQALRVINTIRKAFRVNIDIKHFFLYPTIAGMAAHISNMEVPGGSSVMKSVTPVVPPANLQHSLVALKAGGKKIPLYIICGGGGTAFTFAQFAYLLHPDQPVYAFQQPYAQEELPHVPETIEEIAGRYVNELLLANPHGPYALSGHCIGGAIALEMALQLQAMGKKIHLLAMYDVVLPADETNEQSDIAKPAKLPKSAKKAGQSFMQKIAFELFLLARYPKDAFDYKWEKVKEKVNAIYPLFKEDTEYLLFHKFENKFENAYARYTIKNFPGRMLAFYAKDHFKFVDKDRQIHYKKFSLPESVKNRWKAYCSDVQIFDVDGGHSSIFDAQYASRFAGLLQQHLQTA